MTTPVQQGYPDFLRMASEATVLEINDNPGTQNGIFTYPIRYVGNAKALHIYAQPLALPQRFDFRFYADPAGVFQGANFQIDCQLNDTAIQPVPILSPYMDCRVTPNGVGPYTYTLASWHSPSMQSQRINTQNFVGIYRNGLPVPATTTTTLTTPFVYASDIIWRVRTIATSWMATLYVVDYLGNHIVLGETDNNTNPGAPEKHAYCPAATLKVDLANFDAVANNFDLYLTRRPHWT